MLFGKVGFDEDNDDDKLVDGDIDDGGKDTDGEHLVALLLEDVLVDESIGVLLDCSDNTDEDVDVCDELLFDVLVSLDWNDDKLDTSTISPTKCSVFVHCRVKH